MLILNLDILLNYFLSREALRVSGTVTGEHGIGIGKKQLLIDEF